MYKISFSIVVESRKGASKKVCQRNPVIESWIQKGPLSFLNTFSERHLSVSGANPSQTWSGLKDYIGAIEPLYDFVVCMIKDGNPNIFIRIK